MEVSKSELVAWSYMSNDSLLIRNLKQSSILPEWTNYRDIEIDIIEEAYQEGAESVCLDRHRIDLINLNQIQLGDETKQVKVKRETGNQPEESTRLYRLYDEFSRQMSDQGSSTYANSNAWCPFLDAWFHSNMGKRAFFDFRTCIEPCALGIIQEGVLHDSNSDSEAAFMAKKIRQYGQRSREELAELCIQYYTTNSFLYSVLNKALRDCDLAKATTLGPFAYLLLNHTRSCTEFFGMVYRGMELHLENIDSYRKAVGMWKTWPAYTSTSRDRNVAEMFGNTLFAIEIIRIDPPSPRSFDISNLSKYSHEAEVLIPPGICFRILSVSQNSEQKYIINLKI